MLMRFQKKNLIDENSDTGDSDDHNYDSIRLMESKNPFIRFSIYVKLKKMISSFKGQNLNYFDKNLMRGIYLAKIKDFEEDYID